MKVELVAVTKGVGKYSNLSEEEIIAAIARHGVIKNDNGRLVKYLINEKHFSPLDMVNITFEIETSRAIGRQILRHWSIKPQEHSQRYSKSIGFEPIEIRKEHPTNRQSSTEVFDPELKNYTTYLNGNKKYVTSKLASEAIEDVLTEIEHCYFKLIESGVAKECARMILPECATTVMTMNGSLRSWLGFLNVRLDSHSQKEIVLIATLIGEELERLMPNVFSQFNWRKGMFL